MYLLEGETAKAILFFSGDKIVKEMLFVEFEAILDGFAPDTYWANRDIRACYIEVDDSLSVTAAVFFNVAFTAQGWVDAAWNLPLADLARTSVKGPDLGAGPICVAMQSSCPIQLFSDMLWEPPQAKLKEYFLKIKRTVAKNRLGFAFGSPAQDYSDGLNMPSVEGMEERITEKLQKHNEKELRAYESQVIKDQRVHTAALNTEKDNEVKTLKVDNARRLESMKRELDETRRSLEKEVARNNTLQTNAKNQDAKLQQLREYFKLKLENARTSDSDTLSALKQHYEIEADAKVSGVRNELNDRLKLKEIELEYRAEHEKSLQAEMSKLRQQNQDLIASSGDNLLKSLSLKGVNFVTYQPGAGHITIPISEMQRFIENPIGFTAAYCDVSEEHYEAWLSHFHAPVCDGKLDSGERCCDDLDRVTKPVDYIAGESNLCEAHQSEARREKFKVIKAS